MPALGLALGLGFGGRKAAQDASVPTNITPPSLSFPGNNPPFVGDVAFCDPGEWNANGSPLQDPIYQWQRYNGSDFADIPGANSQEYIVSVNEFPLVLGNNQLRCRVTMPNGAGNSEPANSGSINPSPRVLLEGAGYGPVNGVYTYRQTDGTGMRYNLDGESTNQYNSALGISTDGGTGWRVTDSSGNQIYYSYDSGVHPWQATGWQSVDTETSDPVPTFTLV